MCVKLSAAGSLKLSSIEQAFFNECTLKVQNWTRIETKSTRTYAIKHIQTAFLRVIHTFVCREVLRTINYIDLGQDR